MDRPGSVSGHRNDGRPPPGFERKPSFDRAPGAGRPRPPRIDFEPDPEVGNRPPQDVGFTGYCVNGPFLNIPYISPPIIHNVVQRLIEEYKKFLLSNVQSKMTSAAAASCSAAAATTFGIPSSKAMSSMFGGTASTGAFRTTVPQAISILEKTATAGGYGIYNCSVGVEKYQKPFDTLNLAHRHLLRGTQKIRQPGAPYFQNKDLLPVYPDPDIANLVPGVFMEFDGVVQRTNVPTPKPWRHGLEPIGEENGNVTVDKRGVGGEISMLSDISSSEHEDDYIDQEDDDEDDYGEEKEKEEGEYSESEDEEEDDEIVVNN